MAALTFFIATSSSPKRFSTEELESFIQELLHEQYVHLPVAIFVGPARNALRNEDLDAVNEDARLFRPTEYIIPNAPETMLRLVDEFAQGRKEPSETLWYYGDDELAFRDALHHVPFAETDCCICFRRLNHYLSDCGWYGAVIYILTRPFPVDFMDVVDTIADPLLSYPTAYFFTLASFSGGSFPDATNNPLKRLLTSYFGPELDMKQTWDKLYSSQ